MNHANEFAPPVPFRTAFPWVQRFSGCHPWRRRRELGRTGVEAFLNATVRGPGNANWSEAMNSERGTPKEETAWMTVRTHGQLQPAGARRLGTTVRAVPGHRSGRAGRWRWAGRLFTPVLTWDCPPCRGLAQWNCGCLRGGPRDPNDTFPPRAAGT